MPLEFGWWVVPAVLTLVTWWWAVTRKPRRASRYGFDPTPLLHLAVAVILTLLYWLVYFIPLAAS